MFANVHCHHLHREENVLGSREGKSGDLSSDSLPYVKDKVKFEFEMFLYNNDLSYRTKTLTGRLHEGSQDKGWSHVGRMWKSIMKTSFPCRQ